LLHTAGLEVQDVFESLGDTGGDFDTAVLKLDEYFTPKKDTTHERHVSRRVQQVQRETIV